MAGKREIEFTIDKDGNVSIDVKDGDGPDCLEETRDIEEKLGIVASRKKKPEFYQKRVKPAGKVVIS